jgi:hypothetical protein
MKCRGTWACRLKFYIIIINKYCFSFFLNKIEDTMSTRSRGREFKNFGPWKRTENCLIFVLHEGT